MANLALLTDPEEMRTVSRAVSALAEDFDGIRLALKKDIEVSLNSECAGDVADEFTNYFNSKIDLNLSNEKEKLDDVAKKLFESANSFEETEDGVKAEIRRGY